MAQIAKSISKRLNFLNNINIDEDLVSFAAIAHDLGHPPFGHQGEEALDECMQFQGGFEGNAQTLRIISKVEKKIYNPRYPNYGISEEGTDKRIGLNLTLRSLASVLKYDNIIPDNEEERRTYHEERSESIKPIKGYYKSEESLVQRIKETLLKGYSLGEKFKTVECSIMDIADDIAYSNYDLEDSFKAGFLTPMDLLYPPKQLVENIVESINNRNSFIIDADEVLDILISIYGDILNAEDMKDVEFTKDNREDLIYYYTGYAYEQSKIISINGALRTELTSKLVGKFLRGVEIDINVNCPMLSTVYLKQDIRKEVEVLKTFTYQSQILSPKLKIAELRGKEIVKRIFNTIINGDYRLLPEDFQSIYLAVNEKDKNRIVCDFIAGMTNKYAIEFYGRLTSENPETIFKPI
ncbi:dNTP triphosphohydrolase [Membranihabitans marinus]